MCAEKHLGGKEGYWASYQQELNRVAETEEEACFRLGREWSDSEKKTKKIRCPRCRRWVAVNVHLIPRTVTTRMGEVVYRRHYYYCHKCSFGWYPRDKELGFESEDMTGDVIALVMDFVVSDPFELSASRLRLHHQIERSATGLKLLFERQSAPLADAEKPIPIVRLPLTEANGHQPVVIMNDGSMIRQTTGWHEIKLMSIGVLGETRRVFLAETRDKERFERLLFESIGFAELRSREVLWLADGAPYNWGLQERLCPHAEGLVDFMHVREHIYSCAIEVFGEEDCCAALFIESASRQLLDSRADAVIAQLKECYLMTPRKQRGKRQAAALLDLWQYLEANQSRLNYRKFIEAGWPIGSGAIESAHRWVIQRRMKQAGMMWSAANAQRMATLRALYASVGPEKFYGFLKKSQEMAA